MNEEIKKAEEAIIKLFNGEHVPPPPRYYDDKDDVLDIVRVAAWVLHAFSEPDYESDNVLGIEFWDCKRNNVVLLAGGREVPSFYELPTDYTKVILTCHKIISEIEPGQVMTADDVYFNGLKRHKDAAYAKRFISYMNRRIQEAGGRKDSDGEWPKISSDTLFNVNDLVRSLVSHASGGRMAALVYDKRDPVNMVTYPAGGRTARDRENAILALERISQGIKNIADKARYQDYEVRSEREAQMKKAVAEERANSVTRGILGEYYDRLMSQGDRGAEIIAGHLNGELRIPVFKSTAKRPNPERDAVIDDVEGFLGDNAKDITSRMISGDPTRVIEGLEMLAERLAKIFPEPEERLGM